MLKLNVSLDEEKFDDERQVFIPPEEYTLELEHSLVSLSKWEQVWEKPFLSPTPKTTEETLGYIKAMCISEEVPDHILQRLTNEHLIEVNRYIDAKMSATWFNDKPGSPGQREIITSEVLYYWMFSMQIDKACETWHLNRLFTLLKVFNQKNAPQKKMSRKDMVAQRNMLNAKRKEQLNTTG